MKFTNMLNKVVRGSAHDVGTPYKYTSIKDVGDGFKEAGTKIGTHLKENYNPKDPVFRKSQEGRNINNLWSGYELGGKGKIAVTGSLLGGGTIIAANPRDYQNFYNNGANAKAESEMLDVESLQSTRADGLGYQAQIGAGASQMLTTSGDLVFAMHKTRHSGQF